MRTVIYTRDFEPITIIDLPMWAIDQLHQRRTLWVEVMLPPRWTATLESIKPEILAVCLTAQRLRWIDMTTKYVIVAPDETAALKLKPSWLPGQQGQINAYEDVARSLAAALVKALRNG